MRQQALAEEFMRLAGAFVGSPFQRDLRAMSKALGEMSQMRYASILAEGAETDDPASFDPVAAGYAGKGAYTGAVLELEKILDKLFEAPTPKLKSALENLPSDKFKRLKRLHKSLQSAKGGAFKWASMEEIEKEAILGFGQRDPLTSLDRVLKKYQQQTGERILDLPPGVARKYQSLENEIDKQQARRPAEPDKTPKEPGLVERGQDVGRALGEKGREIGEQTVDKAKEIGRAVGEKAKDVWEAPGKFKEDVGRRYEQFQQERAQKRQQAEKAQEEAHKNIGSYLVQKTPFTDIFYSLPPQIIRELENIGLTPETIKATGRGRQRGLATKPDTVGRSDPSESTLEPTEELVKIASDVVLKYLKAQTKGPSQSSSERGTTDIDHKSYHAFGSDPSINAEDK